MAKLRYIGLVLLFIAVLGTPLVDAARTVYISDTQREDTQAQLCCCKGPKADDCELLEGDQLLTSRAFFNSGEPMCPHKKGLIDYSLYGFKALPPPCKGWVAPPRKFVNVTVKIYWMRHGWSCANALGAQRKGVIKGGFLERKWAEAASLKFLMYEDPGLTNLAIDRANIIGKRIRAKILNDTDNVKPLVFSSAMVRAMETAYWNFPGWSVRPIPYIAEQGSSYDNTPLPFEKQIRKLRRAPNPPGLPELLSTDVNPLDHPDRASLSYKSSYEDWRKYFPSVMAALYEEWEPINATGEIPMVIVSHSKYMAKNLECKARSKTEKKPRNNEVWVQRYTVRLGDRDAVMEPAGCEHLLDVKDYYPKFPKLLCEDALGRCGVDWRPKAWVEQDAPACKKLSEEGIMDTIGRDRAHHEAYLANASSFA